MMWHILARFLFSFALLSLGLPAHSQHDPCQPSAVFAAFQVAVMANTVTTWAQSYRNCPSELQRSVNQLAQSYDSLRFKAAVLETAAHFDGIADTGEVPFDEAFALRQFTVEAWVFPQATNTNWQVIVAKEGGQGYARSFGLFIVPDTWQVHGSVMASDCFQNISLYSREILLPYLWQHVALSYDGTNLRLYVNGSLTAELRYGKPICQSEQPIYMGDHRGIDTFVPYEGWLSEIRLWDRALTPDEISTYRFTVLNGDENGLVGYWRLDDDINSDTLLDAAGGQHGVRLR
jgi:hypothetical protein